MLFTARHKPENLKTQLEHKILPFPYTRMPALSLFCPKKIFGKAQIGQNLP